MLIQKRLKQQGSVAIIPDQVILHSLANGYNFEGGLGWLESPSNPLESHYAVRADGLVVQLVEETQRAEANYLANRRPTGHGAISIETDSSVAATEPWTDAQVEALVELVSDICRRYDIPARSCPAWDQPGIGFHIQFGTPGKWTPVSKSCPGPARIKQVAEVIIPRVRAALAKLPENPTPPDVPTSEEDEMFWMHAPERPTVIVVAGAYSELQPGAAYDAALKGFRDAGVKEYNLSNEAFDAVLRAVAAE